MSGLNFGTPAIVNKECYIVVISYQKHAGNRRLQLSTTKKMELAFMQMANHNGNRALKITVLTARTKRSNRQFYYILIFSLLLLDHIYALITY